MMLLDRVHSELGWPSPEDVFAPTGASARVLTQLASEKIGKTLARLPGGDGVRVGVLAAQPDVTDAPLALVCTFPNPVPDQTLREAQKLAWNFSRSLLLITVEPQIIRKWSCCEIPADAEHGRRSNEIGFWPHSEAPEIGPPIPIDADSRPDQHTARSLWWIELVSGHFFEENAPRFLQDHRADRMLLANLKEIRQMLRDDGLDDAYSHDLLARVIFVQFLFDRRDSSGQAALNAEKLRDLHHDGVLSAIYTNLADILDHYGDAYALFQWLNQRFNGDLFPGKGATPDQQEAEWQAERVAVMPAHLSMLAKFVRGDIELRSGQLCLWPQYAFDAIPLEFISSIYEEFVNGDEGIGVHYTRSHVVDMMLDRVLPWDGEAWDLRILDPACGSGIFLVKAFQRLIYRWKRMHRDLEMRADIPRYLLENNLFGVDQDPNAVRVASFSLYLAMCDEIDPRHYWSDPDHVYFPPLRTKRIVHSDFFEEDKPGFRTQMDAVYDIVVGNPPWGDGTVTTKARSWAKANKWPIANNDIGILFLAKGASLTRPGGQICMVQSASGLLFNVGPPAKTLRRRVFAGSIKVENVINLAAFWLFRGVRVATCILTLRNVEPDGEPFWYACPKRQNKSEDTYRITIEPQDVHLVYPNEAAEEPWIWAALMWGGERDRALIRRLARYPNLERLKAEGLVKTRQGFFRGDRQKKLTDLEGWRSFMGADFPGPFDVTLDSTDLPELQDPYIHSRDSMDVEPFSSPQVVIKRSWVRNTFRFQARFIESQPAIRGVICSRDFVSVHADEDHRDLLEGCAAVYNSDTANYFLFLTSGSLAFYDRSAPYIEDLRRLPIPLSRSGILKGLATTDDVDRRVQELFAFQEAEGILIEDFIHYTLPDYKRARDSRSRLPTRRRTQPGSGTIEPELSDYCSAFLRVLKASYGEDKHIGAIIYSDERDQRLPVRLVSVHLNAPDVTAVRVEPLRLPGLHARLRHLYGHSSGGKGTSFAYGRCVRTYDTKMSAGRPMIVVNIIKPDQVRHWTRAMALRDADDVAADLMMWTSTGYQDREVPVG